MYKSLLIVWLVSFSVIVSAQTLQPANLRCEYRENPAGVDARQPHLSWELKSSRRNVVQKACQVLVSDDLAKLDKNTGNIWDSKKVVTDMSVQVKYAGKPLQPGKLYYWKVRVWDNQNNISSWSDPAFWQMGLLSAVDWKGARWIAYEDLPAANRVLPESRNKDNPAQPNPRNVLPLLRREFNVSKPVKRAIAYISGLGQFEMSLNGKKVGDHFLDPGWTDYEDHALYVTFDLTRFLKPGPNAVGVMLGNGFFHIPKERYKKLLNSFGYPKMIARLAIEYTDGTSESIVSGPAWKTAPGPLTYSSIYGGEDYNAALEQEGWDLPGFKENSTWKSALPVDGPPLLQSQMATPVKIFEDFSPVKVTRPKPGSWVYDLGQNASGIIRITVKGNRGDTVKLIPGELIDENGLVTQKATGSPYNLIYILKGSGTETWQPRFTYYGFRYVQVNGAVPQGQGNASKSPVLLELKGLHIRNSAPRIGEFSCSSDLFNKTERLIDWAIKSNTVSVFTDCPHREKLGWLEEAHLVGSSIRYQYDIASLSRKIVRDMEAAQTSDGLIPDIAPEYTVFTGGFRDSPEWGSNGIIMPWYIYQWYGDQQVLEESYPMMQRYIEYLRNVAKDNILYQGLSDWYDIGPERPGVSQLTPMGVTGTAIYHYDLVILSRIAKLLNKPADGEKYDKLAAEVRQSFNRTFFNKETKQYATGSQAANAMAVYMGLADPADKAAVIENIVKDIRARNNSLTAGDIGYRYLLQVLADEGRSDVIFDMNSRSDVPGYGYQLAHGATALTESWQASRAVSNNHFMLGHILEWFYSSLAGIRCNDQAVAFKIIDIRPEPVGDISSAKAHFNSPYGLIRSEWKRDQNRFELTVEIPANTKANIYLPGSASATITEGGVKISNGDQYRVSAYPGGRLINSLGSGIYHFVALSE